MTRSSSAESVATTTGAGALRTLRVVSTLSVVFFVVQGLTAGEILSRSRVAVSLHFAGAFAVHAFTALTAVAAFVVMRQRQTSSWPTAVAAAVFVLGFAQAALGNAGILAVHVPLAMLLLVGAVLVMAWSFARTRPEVLRGSAVRGRQVDRMSDDLLLAGLTEGDAELSVAFVRRFQGPVFGVAFTVLGDPTLAEDVAQQAFERAWRHAASVRPAARRRRHLVDGDHPQPGRGRGPHPAGRPGRSAGAGGRAEVGDAGRLGHRGGDRRRAAGGHPGAARRARPGAGARRVPRDDRTGGRRERADPARHREDPDPDGDAAAGRGCWTTGRTGHDDVETQHGLRPVPRAGPGDRARPGGGPRARGGVGPSAGLRRLSAPHGRARSRARPAAGAHPARRAAGRLRTARAGPARRQPPAPRPVRTARWVRVAAAAAVVAGAFAGGWATGTANRPSTPMLAPAVASPLVAEPDTSATSWSATTARTSCRCTWTSPAPGG